MNRNKRLLLADRAVWAIFNSLTSVYLVAFALAMGASNTVIGLLGALPWLAGIIMQIPGAGLAQVISRKKLCVIFVTTSRLLWIPILFAPFLFKEPIVFLVVFYLLAKLGQQITVPAWASLIADLVPQRGRGDFMSKRFRLYSLFGMIAITLGGLWLKQFPKESPTGFAYMFGFAAVVGLTQAYIISKLKEPEYQDHEHHHIKEFFTLEGRLKQFVIFGLVFFFGMMLASPFVAVYMLKDLGLSYGYYGMLAALSTLSQVISAHYVGKLTDKYGDKPLAIIGHFATALIPLLFLLVTTGRLWLLVPIHLFGGLAWTIADISRVNLLFDLTDSKKRAMQMAEYNLYTNIPFVIAPILGGWLSENATWILAGIPLIFVLSVIIRVIGTCLLFRIEEPRAKKEYPVMYVFRKAMDFHPVRGVIHSVHVVKRMSDGLFGK